ncbi:putative sortase [Lachnospiraceae bacterium KM106-2]|nr:putative sortase [Lachnospiraceae bacterium KM106-2]
MKQKKSVLDWLRIIFIIGIIMMIPVCIYEAYKYKQALDDYNNVPALTNVPSTKGMPINRDKQENWPKDQLFVESNRAAYTNSSKDALRLIIPKLNLNERVMDGTSPACLKYGPGLFEYAQMPGEGDRNVSIAGHRAGHSKYYNLFRNIHTIKDGDLIYLTYKGLVYCYKYKETVIVKPTDTSVLLLQGYSCLSLISCNPLGRNYERIVVRSELLRIEKQTKHYEFAAR